MNRSERRRRSRTWNPILVLVALTVGLSGFSGEVASADGNFHVVCAFSHANRDDPIVFPRKPGRAHLHHYFGSRDSDAFSTLRSMRRRPTTCAFKPDTAGYWVPALRNRSGKVVRPDRLFAYYWGDKQTRPFRAGLKMLAGGDTHKLKRAGWACGEGHATSSLPRDCGNNKVRAVITFPSCWDGKRKDSPTHRGHMSYPVAGRCTRTHPVEVPKLAYHIRYPISNGKGFRLSSGSATTLHGDFWNTWHQRALRRSVRRCLNHLRKCKLGGGLG
jgi:Domain of unknown function (DUF1996)